MSKTNTPGLGSVIFTAFSSWVTRRGGGAAAAPSLPDLNAETYPFPVVQRLLDQAATFNLLSRPDPQAPAPVLTTAGGAVAGFRLREVLHRFEIAMDTSGPAGLRARNTVGEPAAVFEQRWLLIPPGYAALPDREPPPTALDPARTGRGAGKARGDRRAGHQGGP